MQQFRMKPNSFRQVRNRSIAVFAIILAVVEFLVVIVPALISEDRDAMFMMSIQLIFTTAMMAIILLTVMKRQQSLFESLIIKIDSVQITRERKSTPLITIPAAEIKKIIKNSNGSYTVSGQRSFSPIGIPAQIENPELLEQMLSQFRPIEVRHSNSFTQKMSMPVALSGVLLMAVSWYATNPMLSLLSTSLVSVTLSVSLVAIQSSKNVDIRTKRISWIALIPIISFASSAWQKLLAFLAS